jgi:multiple sugar transport system substrate-binding protein
VRSTLMKYIAALSLVFAITAITVGCGGDDPVPAEVAPPIETPTTIAASTVETTITWSFWGDPWEVDVVERVIAVFEAGHPNIEVETMHEPWDNYFQEIEKWWDADTPPDVMFLEFIPLYAARGLLENLDSYIERDGYDLVDFYPSLIDTFTYEGSVYGLARDNDTKVIFYNKDLFDEAGLSHPSPGWTWEEMREAAIKLTKTDGEQTSQYGFAFEPNDWWRLWVWRSTMTTLRRRRPSWGARSR